MRATLYLHRDAGAWKIVHEHTSVTFYMDGSFRFSREPSFEGSLRSAANEPLLPQAGLAQAVEQLFYEFWLPPLGKFMAGIAGESGHLNE